MAVLFAAFMGIAVLAAVCGLKQSPGARGSGSRSDRNKEILRIDRPHYYDPDEHECSACGTRFREDTMVCPGCGARFTGTKADEEEYTEEWLEEEEWDEEEGL